MPNCHALLIGVNHYPNLPNADLRGCLTDVALMHGVLTSDRFGFDPDAITVLRDEQASRDGILAAMAEIEDMIGRNDIVVLFYAGHGSRSWPDGRNQPAVESIVPADSGRDTKPNRDILDREIDQWVQRLNQETPFVTLVMDCCHSGSVTRDAFGERVRSLPGDARRFSTWAAATDKAVPDRIDRDPAAIAGWIADRRRAVVVAACQPNELAWEHPWFDHERQVTQRAGALTFFLSQALATAAPDATWRTIVEPLAPLLHRSFPSQNPLAEGKVDALLFGRRQVPVSPSVPVLAINDDRITLGGGLAHGVRVGSQWRILIPANEDGAAAEVKADADADADDTLVEITSVQPTTSVGDLAAPASRRVALGQRAFLAADAVATTLSIAFAGNHRRDHRQWSRPLRDEIEKEALLTWTGEPETADALIHRVPRREAVQNGDPLHHLGPLDRATWAAVGHDGDLVVRLHDAGDDAGADTTALIHDLVRVARFHSILAIENPVAAHSLQGRVELRVERSGARAPAHVPGSTSGSTHTPPFAEGERADFVIVNTHTEPVFVTLVELGTDHRIKLIAPYSGHPTYQIGGLDGQPAGGIRLAPNARLSVRDYYAADPDHTEGVRDGLALRLPPGFPWRALDGPDRPGHVYLKLMVTSTPADFRFLTQLGTRPLDHVDPDHPLTLLAQRCAWGHGKRSFTPVSVTAHARTEWTTVTVAVDVQRTAPYPGAEA